ncbi:MAG: hypothetical protein AAF940_14715 [Pseudomonadota bacterium]
MFRDPALLKWCTATAIVALLIVKVFGFFWSFLLLAGFWSSANIVAWFGRHPPPQSAFGGGDDDHDSPG